MDRRRGLLQDNAIFYFDFSTSQGSYHELIESLKRESPVRSLDIRCIEFDTLSVDPLLDIIKNRSQLQRIMLTYPENWPTDKAVEFCQCVAANPNIETVWLSEIQAFSSSLRTILSGLVPVRKLLVSMDQLRGNPSVRLGTCTTLQQYVLHGTHLTLCDVRFTRQSFAPLAQALLDSTVTLEFRWCSFDAEATQLLQQAYTGSSSRKKKRMSLGFESIRNPFPVAESQVYKVLLGKTSNIAKLKLDTFLKGTTDFLETLQAIQDCPSLTHLSLWHLDSCKYAATAKVLPTLRNLRQFSFSVTDTLVSRAVMVSAVRKSASLERVLCGGDLTVKEQAAIDSVCQRNVQIKAWMQRGATPSCGGAPCALMPHLYATMSKCVYGQSFIATSLMDWGDEMWPEKACNEEEE